MYLLFGTVPPYVAFKCKNYYRSRGEIRQTFFHQIDFFADSPNFNPFKLSPFTVLNLLYNYNSFLTIDCLYRIHTSLRTRIYIMHSMHYVR